MGGADLGRAAEAAAARPDHEDAQDPEQRTPGPSKTPPPEGGQPDGTRPVEPDAEQVEAVRARTMLELAGAYTRVALKFPDEIRMLRGMVAEFLFENAALRWQLDQLAGRVAALERRAGVRR